MAPTHAFFPFSVCVLKFKVCVVPRALPWAWQGRASDLTPSEAALRPRLSPDTPGSLRWAMFPSCRIPPHVALFPPDRSPQDLTWSPSHPPVRKSSPLPARHTELVRVCPFVTARRRRRVPAPMWVSGPTPSQPPCFLRSPGTCWRPRSPRHVSLRFLLPLLTSLFHPCVPLFRSPPASHCFPTGPPT